MDIFNYLLDFFGISLLSETSTFYDLINVGFSVFGALFLFTFITRSLFLLMRFGER